MTTENKKKIDEYWIERALQQEQNAQIVADRYMAQIGQSLADYKHQLVSEIEKFYARYAVDNKMTHAEAKRYLTDKERREFKHVTLERFREIALNPDTPTPLLDALGYRHRISRKEALLAEIERLTAELYGKPDGIHDKVTEALSDVYIKGKIHQAKNLAHFGIIEKPILSVDAVKHKMASNWSGRTFSENVWVHKEVAYKAISDVLNKGLTGGWSIDRMARALSERTGVAYHRADTLVRTETTFYNNLATLDTIKELGGDHYEIVAVLDSRTSEICQSENHEVYSVKEYEPGRTAPPFHVRCRSTIRPAVKSDKKGKTDKTDKTDRAEEAEQISPYLDILLNNAPVKMAKEKRSMDEIFAGWEREGEAIKEKLFAKDGEKENVEKSKGNIKKFDFYQLTEDNIGDKERILNISKRLKAVSEEYEKETGKNILELFANKKLIDRSKPYDDEKSKFIRFLYKRVGYDRKPNILNDNDIVVLETIYRGVSDSKSGEINSKTLMDNFRNGKLDLSGRVKSAHGRGLYFGSRFVAERYANKGTNPLLIKAFYDPSDFKFLTDELYKKEKHTWLKNLDDDNELYEYYYFLMSQIGINDSNADVFAVLHGYDGYKAMHNDGLYTVVYNRSKLGVLKDD
ncbi:minor capsid protein [Streptococcus sp. 53]|uniref:minor capsid protein n=1 Tax=Streptococcus sp. 53 TaxID=2582679 RepID=UPI0015632CBB|nr:minor capsid protein [Streptococcus sp. 53]